MRRALAPLGEVLALPKTDAAGSPVGDLLHPDALTEQLRKHCPDVVVNAAAYTAVDKAEADVTVAHAINATAPGAVAAAVAAMGGWLLHFSTDYVFDGSGDTPRDEAAPTAPLSVYGRTKLEGEALIRASGCQHLILRTSWVHAARGGNFAKTMLRLAADRETLSVIDDQFGAPTGADLLADISAHALRQALRDPLVSGTYHAVAAGETSWHGYARHVLAFAQQRGVVLKAGPDTAQPVSTSSYPTAARRPLNSRLSTQKLQQTFGLRMPDWRVGVERMLSEALQLP